MRDFIRRRLGLVVVLAAFLLLTSANRISTFATDLWWFSNLGYRSVFTGILGTQIALGAIFGLVLFVIVAVNLQIARRLRPFVIPATPQQAVIERYRQMADPYLPWLIVGVSALFALTAGGAVSSQWDQFLLWQNSQTFGVADPQFGRDVGFYVFELPWLKFAQQWLFTSLLLTLFLSAGAHYLLGGIRPEAEVDKVTPQVKTHLSVLLALVLGARALGYYLDRFLLNFSPRGQVTGASFTDVNAELPALNLLLVISVVAIAMVLVSVRRRGFLLPGAAIGLLVLSSMLLSGAYPAVVQRLRVDPQELAREDEFIDRNLVATRAAYGLSDVQLQPFAVTNDLDRADVDEEEITLENVRLWDPEILETTYDELQALRPYYEYRDVDVDRYVLDGKIRQVMLATRELDQSGLPDTAQTWQNQRLTFTHGFGLAASQVNRADQEGQPVFLAKDIPPEGAEGLVPTEQAAIYYGERNNPTYSIVNTNQPELDYEVSEQQVNTSYAGLGGVQLQSFGRKLAFAVRFGDPNYVLSNLIREDSRVLFKRDIEERVTSVAPYLTLDRDPYPVVLENRILWVQDAYTHSAFYPYSQRIRFRGQEVNYLRNSVKAVVDAYDGTVTLYVVDEGDAIVRAWRQIFPAPYRDLADAPEGLREHFRYPEDLFQAQALIYSTYHIPGTEAFYNKADAWDIPRDASRLANDPNRDPANTPMRPYYLLMRLPGEAEEEFVLIQPYLARNKPNMIAWLAGRSDPEHYGELFAVQFPGGTETILGPQQVQARIEQEDNISEYITLRDQAGSNVIRGNLLVIPIGTSILYVEPLFIQSPQALIPELARVVLVMGERVVMERNLGAALTALVGAAPEGLDEPVDGAGQDPDEDTSGFNEDELLLAIQEAFTDAEEALRDGNLARYQSRNREAERLLEQLIEERGLAPEPEPTPAPEGEAPADGGDGTADGSGEDGDTTPA